MDHKMQVTTATTFHPNPRLQIVDLPDLQVEREEQECKCVLLKPHKTPDQLGRI
jgi:hypothetical protein